MTTIINRFFDIMMYYLTSLDVSPLIIITHMSVAFVLSLIIFLVYKITFAGVVYSKSFNVSLVIITLLTTMVMMIIRSSVALSLGMVGALSIVRFRTALKQPKDIAYMFWAITTGLSIGAGAYLLAIIGCVFITAILIMFNYKKSGQLSYLLVLKGLHNEDMDIDEKIDSLMDKYTKRSKVKTQNITDEKYEYMYEVYLNTDNTREVLQAFKSNGIQSCNLIAYNNDLGN